MERQIIVNIRNVYGNEVAYPVNGQAQKLAALVNQKTLTAATLRLAEKWDLKFCGRQVAKA